MSETKNLLDRQSAWQKSRAKLTWPEKVRMAASLREWAAWCRRARHARQAGAVSDQPSGAHLPEGNRR